MKHAITSLVLGAALVACDNPKQPSSPGGPTASVQSEISGTQVVTGEIGPGAQYALYRPEQWNGRLLLYAHGSVPPTSPVQLPVSEVSGLRDALVARGVGFAYSSYSENGFAVKDGTQRTRQLRGLFAAEFGDPERTYVIGRSLGGVVALMLAEQNPGLFDGALPMCGFVGGSQRQIDYVVNVWVLFSYFFPGVLPGDGVHVPDNVDFRRDVAPAASSALLGNPARAKELAGVVQIEIPYTSFSELVNSILSALAQRFGGDLLSRLHGRSPFDNTATIYTGSSDDAALNAGVARSRSSPDAENYLAQYYEPDGRLQIPVLTLHTRRDPVNPFAHETAYAGVVAAQEASDLLVQRTFDRFGHCTFSVPEQVAALEDLVRWAEAGVKPAP